jgi:hypothetical protein
MCRMEVRCAAPVSLWLAVTGGAILALVRVLDQVALRGVDVERPRSASTSVADLAPRSAQRRWLARTNVRCWPTIRVDECPLPLGPAQRSRPGLRSRRSTGRIDPKQTVASAFAKPFHEFNR